MNPPLLNPPLLMPVAVLVPLIGVLAIVLTRRRPNLREAATLLTASILFCLTLRIGQTVLDGGRPAITLVEVVPGIGLGFAAEPLGAMFACVASLLWIVTSVYSIGYMRGHGEQNQTRFYAFFAVALACTVGAAYAANLLTLFVFYEALTLSTVPLVAHEGSKAGRRAGRTYLGLLLGTSILFLLPAIVATWVATHSVTFTPGGIMDGKVSPALGAVLLGLYVFGIGKAALMPFHRWLPAAMVAPTPVSALLHAVAVVKTGVFAILKVTVYVFGLKFLGETGTNLWLAYLAGATIVIASLVAMTKDNLKARLAYSTIGQLSYIVLGAMLASGAGVVGGAMHIAMHAFAKITLFFCAGAILVASHRTEVSTMRGLGRRMPLTFAAFLLASLGIIGLPPTGGTWSKWQLVLASASAGQSVLIAALLLSSLLSSAYLLPVAVLGFLPPCREQDAAHPDLALSGVREAPVFCLVPICLTAACTIAMFFLAEPLYAFLHPLLQNASP